MLGLMINSRLSNCPRLILKYVLNQPSSRQSCRTSWCFFFFSFWSLMGLMHPHGSLFPCFQLIIWEQPLSFSQNQSKCPPPVHLFIYIENVQIRELLHINITARLKPVDSVAFINKKQNKTKHCTPFFFLQQKRQCMWQATLDIMCSLYWKTLWVNVNCHMWDSSRCCRSEANAQ